jgi:hypothetical protein
MLRRLPVLLGELQRQRLRPGRLRRREPALHGRRAVLLSSLLQRPLQSPLRRRRRPMFQRRRLLHGSVQQRKVRLHPKRRLRLLRQWPVLLAALHERQLPTLNRCANAAARRGGLGGAWSGSALARPNRVSP